MSVTAAGFAAYELNNIDLEVGQNLNLNVPLTIGQTQTTVDVVGAAEMLDDTKVDVSQVVGTQEIANLPLNGRRVDVFVLNTPGVTNDATFGLLTSAAWPAKTRSCWMATTTPSSSTTRMPDVRASIRRSREDAVQEFQVVSANVSAEYGRAMGGVVNTVTKSGGNQFHGTRLLLPAQHRFRRARSVLGLQSHRASHPDRRNGGGAIVKDKLFYFLSADVTRRNFPFVDSQVKAGFLAPTPYLAGRVAARARRPHRGAMRRHQRSAAALLRADSPHRAQRPVFRPDGLSPQR